MHGFEVYMINETPVYKIQNKEDGELGYFLLLLIEDYVNCWWLFLISNWQALQILGNYSSLQNKCQIFLPTSGFGL